MTGNRNVFCEKFVTKSRVFRKIFKKISFYGKEMPRPRTGDTAHRHKQGVPHDFPLLIRASSRSRGKARSTMLKKNAGRLPGVFIVFQPALRNLELLIDRDPEVTLDIVRAALAIKVRQDAINCQWCGSIEEGVDAEGKVGIRQQIALARARSS